ncbi:MAG: hypothetical protein AAF518_10260 [Spirochaetota bacterium]
MQAKLWIFFFAVFTLQQCKIEKRAEYQNKPHQSIFTESNGLYVYYEDKRQAKTRYTGLLKTDKDSFICRTFIGKEKAAQINIRLKYRREYQVLPQKGTTSKNKALMQYCIREINHIANQYLQLSRQKFPAEIQQEDEWPDYGYTLVHRFAFWIPFFNYYGSGKKGKASDFTLISIGRHFQGNPDSDFFAFRKLPQYKSLPPYTIGSSTTIERTHEKIHFALDKNWLEKDLKEVQIPNLLGFYQLPHKTSQDAQINIDKFSLPDLKVHNLYELIRLITPFHHIIPSSQKIYRRNGRIVYEFDNIDPKSGYINHSISTFILFAKGEVYSFNLSGFHAVLEKNHAYFLKILDSIHVE